MIKTKAQIISEALIPLLGYFFWNWSIHFIFLFLFLDWIAKEISLHFQGKKIKETQGSASSFKSWRTYLLSAILLCSSILIVEHWMSIQNPSMSLVEEIKEFLFYEEMGIAQIYFLLPLIAFSIYMEYKMQFLKMKWHFRLSLAQLWKSHIRNASALLLAIIVGLTMSQFFIIPDWSIIICIMLGPIVFALIEEKLN
jgi:hypothetical protein